MQTTLPRLGVRLATVVLAGLCSATLLANPVQTDRQAPQSDQKLKPVEGELVSVNMDAKTLDVRLTDGTNVRFRFDEKTEVSGATHGVAGLATEKGAKVTVQYKADPNPPEGAPEFLATRIDVHEAGR